jgi:hypothetical protein
VHYNILNKIQLFMAKRVVGKCAHDSVFVKDIDWQKDLS